MKRLLLLGNFPAPYRVDVFKEIVKEFDCDVFFATDKDQNRSSEYNVTQNEFKYLLVSSKKGNKCYKSCLKSIREYSAVIAYDWYLPFAIKVEELCIRNNIPYFINCDGAFISNDGGFKDKLKFIVKRRYIRNAKICFSSGKFANDYLTYYGASNVNIVEHHFTSLHSEDILNNPVNHFEKLKFKKNLGLSNRKMVLSIGQFIHRKGIDVLLNAWANLDENYQLVIVGGGEEKALYEEIIKELNLKNVTLVDFRPKAQIIKYYRAADLFVLPTREDIWGLVINEAMANGLPIVSTDKCIAALELIDDNGIIVPSDNPIALENAICGLLGNTQKLVDYSKTSLEIIQNHVVEDIGKSHVRVIQSVVG